MAKKYVNPGCIKCGNKNEDLRFGWCYPCFEKAQKIRSNDKTKAGAKSKNVTKKAKTIKTGRKPSSKK